MEIKQNQWEKKKKKNGSSAVTLLFQRALSPIHHLLFIRTDAYTRSSMNFYILHLFFFFYSRYADGIKTSNVRERESGRKKKPRSSIRSSLCHHHLHFYEIVKVIVVQVHRQRTIQKVINRTKTLALTIIEQNGPITTI